MRNIRGQSLFRGRVSLIHGQKRLFLEHAKRSFLALAVLASFMLVIGAGCDMSTEEISPENLPPVPEKCVSLSDAHKSALASAYSSVRASQMQVSKIAGEFAKCMEDEGLSRAAAKGILKKNEAEARQATEKSGGQDIPVVQ